MLKQKALSSTNRQGLLPNLIIIGAMKCGTSSLHQYLNLHPQIHMSNMKELDFFIQEKNWNKGLSWYQSNFCESAQIIGEASPNYTKYPMFQDVPRKIYQLVPQAKLIYILRDPIKRIVSHYSHQYTDRCEFRTISEALSSNLIENHYVNCSRYYLQLEQFIPYFPIEKILVISLESLSKNPKKTLDKAFDFLEVDSFDHNDFLKVFHQSNEKKRLTSLGSWVTKLPAGGRLRGVIPGLESAVEKPKLETSIYQKLAGFLAEDVEKLKKLTGHSFPEWSI
ncbi:MAG: sulfotransferase [Microcoleaceae cyanobacterium]